MFYSVLTVFFCFSRKHLFAGSGAIDAHLKHEKVQRQRSDCQPISAISPNLDTYDPFDPASPTIVSIPVRHFLFVYTLFQKNFWAD